MTKGKGSTSAEKTADRQAVTLRAPAGTNPAVKRRAVAAALVVVAVVALVAAAGFLSYRHLNAAAALEIADGTIRVGAGGDLQAALDRARPGDTIVLEAGAVYRGAFKLPNKSGAEFITVRTSAVDALPPAGTRLDPARHAALLPRVEASVKGEPALLAIGGAHHFRFIGLEFGPTIEGLYDIIQLGTTAEEKIEELPHHIEFDRVWVHGGKETGQRRGIAANGRHIVIRNSYFSDIMRRGEESQAIAVWATDGPVEIVNNYLESAAENILFGGAPSTLRLVPADCLVRGNHLNKPLAWREKDWVVKNLFEIKNGARIRIENNLMTNNWAMGQDGTAVLFTTRADNGEATVIRDIEFVGNIVRGAANALNVFGGEGAGGRHLKILHNRFEDIDGPKWGSAGYFLKASDWDGLFIEHNTVRQTGNILTAYGKPVRNFVFRHNVVAENEYGVKGDGTASGQASLDRFFPGASFACNAIVGGKPSLYREKNIFIGSYERAEAAGGGGSRTADARSNPPQECRARPGAELDSRAVGGNRP